jgi:hypothetical protein
MVCAPRKYLRKRAEETATHVPFPFFFNINTHKGNVQTKAPNSTPGAHKSVAQR